MNVGTCPNGAADTGVSGTAASLFTLADGAYGPTALAQGPWDPRFQSGVVLGALVAHLAEQTPAPAAMFVARLVLDILRPTPMVPLATRTTVVRDGKRLQLIEIELIAEGEVTVRGSALRLRHGTSPATVEPVHPLAPADLPSLNRSRSGLRDVVETRLESGGLEEIGPGVAWVRVNCDVVPGVAVSPLVQAAMAADMGSGTSSYVPWREWTFANVDITLHLSREPAPGWLRIAARTESAGNGVAVVDTRLADAQGEFGHAHQTLFVDRRPAR